MDNIELDVVRLQENVSSIKQDHHDIRERLNLIDRKFETYVPLARYQKVEMLVYAVILMIVSGSLGWIFSQITTITTNIGT